MPTPEAEDGAAADAGDRHGARGSEARAESDPGVPGHARDPGGRSAPRFPERLAPMRRPAMGARCRRPWRTRLAREWAHLRGDRAPRWTTLTAERDAQIATGTDRVAAVARQLCHVRGVAETSAAVFSAELFGTRTFANGRQLGALTGLVPVPYRSDQRVQDQGISKAGRGRTAARGDSSGVGVGALATRQRLDPVVHAPVCGRRAGGADASGLSPSRANWSSRLWRFVAHGRDARGCDAEEPVAISRDRRAVARAPTGARRSLDPGFLREPSIQMERRALRSSA